MPVQVTFTRIGETVPADYYDIDAEICEHVLDTPVHDVEWGGGKLDWYNSIGFALALGASPEKIKSVFKNPLLRGVMDFLESRYVISADRTWS
jgi:hypothetical protein